MFREETIYPLSSSKQASRYFAGGIKRCITRINEEYQGNEDNLYNFTKQDSIILNIQRSCELSIDLLNIVISKFGFEIPKNNRASFEILNKNGIISKELLEIMKKMIGF
mgnify:CR=1 FL=1